MEEVYIKNESQNSQEIKPFKCAKCEVTFTTKQSLLRHNQYHCGQNEREETKNSINNLFTESDNEFQFLLQIFKLIIINLVCLFVHIFL